MRVVVKYINFYYLRFMFIYKVETQDTTSYYLKPSVVEAKTGIAAANLRHAFRKNKAYAIPGITVTKIEVI